MTTKAKSKAGTKARTITLAASNRMLAAALAREKLLRKALKFYASNQGDDSGERAQQALGMTRAKATAAVIKGMRGKKSSRR